MNRWLVFNTSILMDARTANHTYNTQSFIHVLDLLRLLYLPRHSTGLIPSGRTTIYFLAFYLLLKTSLLSYSMIKGEEI